VEVGEVAVEGLVIAGGQGAPALDLVDAAFDGVAFLVQIGVAADGVAAASALPLAVGGLVGLLGYDGLDVAASQVGAVGSAGVCLIGGERR
jgi:hypothetical protein